MAGLRDKIVDAGRSLRSVFANPALRRLQIAFAGSIVGDWAYAVAVALYAFEQGGPTAVGILGVIRYVSLAVITPFASTLGDRYPRRLVMISSDLSRAMLIAVAAVLIWSDGPPVAVYALAVVTAICGSPFRSSQASILPQLARDPIELAAANVASSTIESIGFFAGPALAGLLLAVTSIPVVYVFNAITFVLGVVVLVGAAIGALAEGGKAGVANPGAHGFSEILYAFSSAGNNNGSAFAGLSANTPFYNTALGFAMLISRYWLIIPVLAVAGSFAAKKTVPAGPGTLPTHTPLFVVLIIGTLGLVGALTFGKAAPYFAAFFGGTDWRVAIITTSLLAAIGGLLLTFVTYSGEASSAIGGTYTLNSIAAVVIGGTSLAGGAGSAIGSVFGAFVLRTIGDLLFVFDLEPLWQPLFQGVILLVAVSLGALQLLKVSNRLELFR